MKLSQINTESLVDMRFRYDVSSSQYFQIFVLSARPFYKINRINERTRSDGSEYLHAEVLIFDDVSEDLTVGEYYSQCDLEVSFKETSIYLHNDYTMSIDWSGENFED